MFTIDLSREGQGNTTFAALFEVLASINFGTQIDLGVVVGLDTSARLFTLTADYIGDDITAIGAVSGLLPEVQNASSIHATKESPATFTISASKSPFTLKVEVSSRFTVNVSGFGQFSGTIQAAGNITNDFDGYFIGKLNTKPAFTAEPPINATGLLYVSIATRKFFSS